MVSRSPRQGFTLLNHPAALACAAVLLPCQIALGRAQASGALGRTEAIEVFAPFFFWCALAVASAVLLVCLLIRRRRWWWAWGRAACLTGVAVAGAWFAGMTVSSFLYVV